MRKEMELKPKYDPDFFWLRAGADKNCLGSAKLLQRIHYFFNQ